MFNELRLASDAAIFRYKIGMTTVGLPSFSEKDFNEISNRLYIRTQLIFKKKTMLIF